MLEYDPPVSIQDEVLNFLLTSPRPEEIVAFHASEEAQRRLAYLLDVHREGTLSAADRAELEEASQLNHLFTLLKAKASSAANMSAGPRAFALIRRLLKGLVL